MFVVDTDWIDISGELTCRLTFSRAKMMWITKRGWSGRCVWQRKCPSRFSIFPNAIWNLCRPECILCARYCAKRHYFYRYVRMENFRSLDIAAIFFHAITLSLVHLFRFFQFSKTKPVVFLIGWLSRFIFSEVNPKISLKYSEPFSSKKTSYYFTEQYLNEPNNRRGFKRFDSNPSFGPE